MYLFRVLGRIVHFYTLRPLRIALVSIQSFEEFLLNEAVGGIVEYQSLSFSRLKRQLSVVLH
jgi:hypothetical protein